MKFIIVSQQRQGSTLMQSLLKSHSMIQCEGEIFKPRFLNESFPKWALVLILRFPALYVKYFELKCKMPVFTFKFMVNQLKHPRSFVHQLIRRGYKVISIRRNDAIGIAISRCIAEQTNIWFINNVSRRSSEKVTIDVPYFFNTLKKVEAYSHLQDKVLKGVDYLSINYEEDLCRNDQFEYFSRAIANYTGLPFELLKTNSLPTDDRKDSERIQNFDELMEAIKGSSYAHYLNKYLGNQD